MAVACKHIQPDRSPEELRFRSDWWMERTRGVPDQPTSHRRWPWSTFSIPFFKAGFVWITQISVVAGVGSPLSFNLERTYVHGTSARIDVCGRGEHALKLQWIVSWRQRLLSEVLQGLRTPTEAGPIFQIIVDDMVVEMWLGWLENHGMTWKSWDGKCTSCWHHFHCGGCRACSLRAAELDPARRVSYVEGSAVLTCCTSTSAWGFYQHVLATLIMETYFGK